MENKTNEFIKKSKEIHWNKYDYSKSKYINMRTKIMITCLAHGDFEQIPSKHLMGQGCAKCSGHYKKTTNDFINDAIQIHGNKYNYSKVNYINSREKIIITCQIHGDFEQTPNNHIKGQGCAKCSGHDKKTTSDFINDATQIHGNKYDYSKVNYINSHEKIIIICNNHGEFEQLPFGHLNGHGCKKCANEQNANMRLNNINYFIKKSIEVHGNKYDYTKVIYSKACQKVIIVCKMHGEFEQIAIDHYNGHGCKKCSIEQNANNYRSNVSEFIEKSNLIHNNKYDYSKSEYVNGKTKTIIICKKHGEFKQSPLDHLNGYGCRKCANEQNAIDLKSNTNEFIEKSIKMHGDKYDYTKVNYIDSHEKVIVTCKMHGEFKQSPYSHLSGHGCKKCANEQNANNRRKNIIEFIEKSKLIHNNKYDYFKSNYVNNNTKIIIICREHGEFEQIPSHHLNGRGCPKCAIKQNADNFRSNTDEFIKKSIKIHGDKYDYTKTNYTYSYEKLIITCKIHGEFEQRASEHYKGSGCPKCFKKYSIQQIEWLNFIQTKDNIYIQHGENSKEYQIPNTRFKADGYCKETNTIYEYHGDYWHGNPKKFNSNEINKKTKCTFGELYKKTLQREKRIKDMGFNLITIWESDWIRLNECVKILQKKFKTKNNV